MVFCNIKRKFLFKPSICHNPYFNRWFSAIWEYMGSRIKYESHNPYFNRWFSAIETNKTDIAYKTRSQSLF